LPVPHDPYLRKALKNLGKNCWKSLTSLAATVILNYKQTKGNVMAKFNISLQVEYIFELEADTPEEAERLAWEYDYNSDISAYAGVYSIDVDEVYED
jgi:hypothetical protein